MARQRLTRVGVHAVYGGGACTYTEADRFYSYRRDKITGHLRKREFGGWIFGAFKILTRLKILRGTALDPFGYTSERRIERALASAQ